MNAKYFFFNVRFFRVLEIVQNEDYLTAADTSIIRRKDFEDIQYDFGLNEKIQDRDQQFKL